MMVDVCLPGTGGMVPLENRWLSCCWIEYQGKSILIDCGEGTQIALKKCGLKLSRLEILLITHYHADHVAGLPGLLLTLGNNGKEEPLTIFGPPGLKEVVSALTLIAPYLPYPLQLVELDGVLNDPIVYGDILITPFPLEHGMPCMGYLVEVRRKPVFNPEKSRMLGVPVHLNKLLHSGQVVELEDGRIIKPEMVLDGQRPSVRICYCTDTRPLDTIVRHALNADLFICEGMYAEDSMAEKMDERGHMVFRDSARMALEASVKRLWLTHFSPAMTNPGEYTGFASNVFPNTTVAHDGIHIDL
jgi:ribonuclease Z